VLERPTPAPILGNIPHCKGLRMTREYGDRIARRVARYARIETIIDRFIL